MKDGDEQQLQHFLYEVPNLVKATSPLANKAFLFATFGTSVGGLAYGMSAYDHYTPQNTNAMNLFVSMMCHLGIVIGPSALFALKMIRYSVYPSDISLPSSNSPQVRYGRFQSGFCNLMTHNLTLCALVPSLMFLGLNVLDSLNPVFVVPCILAQGIIVSCAYYNTQFLTAPLWVTR